MRTSPFFWSAGEFGLHCAVVRFALSNAKAAWIYDTNLGERRVMTYGAVVWSVLTMLAVCHNGPAAAQEQKASHYEYTRGATD